MSLLRRTIFAFVMLLCIGIVFAANNPGHDSLYVLKIGDNITGTINVSGNITATLVQATSRFFGPNIDIRGDGTSSANANQIVGSSTNLELSSSGNLILNRAVTGGTVYVGWPGTTTSINVTGNIFGAGTLNVTGNAYASGSQICTVSNGLCAGSGTSSSAGGWVNDSTSTRTTVRTIVNSSSGSGSFIVQNQTGSTHLFVNGTTGFVGIGTASPSYPLNVQSAQASYLGAFYALTNGGAGIIALSGQYSGQLVLGPSGLATITGNDYGIVFSVNGGGGLAVTPYSTVGVDTTAPVQNFEVNGTSNVTGAMYLGNTKCGNGRMLTTDPTTGLISCDSLNNSGWLNTSTRVYLANNLTNVSMGWNAGVPLFYFDTTNGYFGTGTSTPSAPITASSTIASPQILAYGNGNGGFIAVDRSADSAGGGGMIFKTRGDTKGYLMLPLNDNATLRIAGPTAASVVDFKLTTGFVGFGTTAPTQLLHVNGTSNFTGAMYLGNTLCTSGQALTTDATTGLISCTSVSSSGSNGWTNSTTTTRTTLQTIVNSSNPAGSFIVQNQAGSTHLFVNGSTGYVGVGTAVPLSALSVVGISYASNQEGGIRLMSAGNEHYGQINIVTDGSGVPRLGIHPPAFGGSAETFSISNIGYVGIGTTAPTQSLDVNGSAKFAGSITMPANFFIGSSAAAVGTNAIALGASANASGVGGVAIGASAKANGTNQGTAVGNSAAAYGSQGTAFGVGATSKKDSANAVGFNSVANGTGSNAFGASASASGINSVAFGGLTNAYGDDSISVGYLNYAYGINSIAIGPVAYTSNSGSDAIAIGDYSTSNFTDSIALGANATTTRANQLVIGNASTYNNVNGTIFGIFNATGNMYASGSQVCTAANGLCAGGGTSSGWLNSSGSGNVSLAVPSANVSINTLFIDNSNGRVGIGTSTPLSLLSIKGGDLKVNGSSQLTMTMDGLNIYNGAGIYFTDSGGTTFRGPILDDSLSGWYMRNLVASGSLRFETTNAASGTNIYQVFLGNTGNVGINTSTPGSTLEVTGTVAISGIANTSGSIVNAGNMTFSNAASGNTTTFEVWKDNNGKAVVTRYWNGTALVLNVSG